ncbi:hypothetical protein PCANC_05339 [Puccinia coronata f. sp. avenae]|uniref:Uncharacterized protein n=1 Tax=Puccinia coronata f. sp. avenae TaxID=200324 RepID=A0A2N5V197_9BASI|nr:hypothetical protein PCASD_09376 [Puccinia coronata f. sp. avenae]PLW54632.1 hypothetical protein PCANC_05339 [Puccinia coronata f. sp. avenae]
MPNSTLVLLSPRPHPVLTMSASAFPHAFPHHHPNAPLPVNNTPNPELLYRPTILYFVPSTHI